MTKRWKRALEQAGVRYRVPYHTRHTYATMMLLAGESPYYVASQLGHSDLAMLEKRYARFIEMRRSREPGAAMAEVHGQSLEVLAKLVGAQQSASPGGVSGSLVSEVDRETERRDKKYT